MVAIVTAGIVAGLVGSPHCVGMCGGFASACGVRPGGLAAWNLGRLLAYVTLGAAIGSLGAVPTIGRGVAVVLLALFALRLADLGPKLPAVPGVARLGATLARRTGLGARVAFGAVSALLPCGLLWSALAVAAAAGSPARGAVSAAAFWLGTVPALTFAGALVRRLAGARPWTRRAVALGVLAAGLWAISVRPPSPNPEVPIPCHHPETP
jgi:sulfite exporter TauE/SafE